MFAVLLNTAARGGHPPPATPMLTLVRLVTSTNYESCHTVGTALRVKFSHYTQYTLCKFPPERGTLPNFYQCVAPQYSLNDKRLKQYIACSPRDYCTHSKLQLRYSYQHHGAFCLYSEGNMELLVG